MLPELMQQQTFSDGFLGGKVWMLRGMDTSSDAEAQV
jgi:hypothetical protein